MKTLPYPVIRLRPTAEARTIRHGAPWVFDNEIVADRRTRALAPGTIALLEDHDRVPLALVAVNPTSRIMARVLERDVTARIDHDWLAARLAQHHPARRRLPLDRSGAGRHPRRHRRPRSRLRLAGAG